LPDDIEQIGQSVEQIYAAALLELADQAGQLDAMRSEMDMLGLLLGDQPDLVKLFASRVLSTAERAGSIERIFAGRVSDLLYRFLQVVNDKGRLIELAGIIEAFAGLVDRRWGIIDVDAHVAVALPTAQAKRVADELSQALGGKVTLHQKVEPHLIGGLKLRVGDRLVDGSVITQLRRMEQRITAEGRARARTDLEAIVDQ